MGCTVICGSWALVAMLLVSSYILVSYDYFVPAALCILATPWAFAMPCMKCLNKSDAEILMEEMQKVYKARLAESSSQEEGCVAVSLQQPPVMAHVPQHSQAQPAAPLQSPQYPSMTPAPTAPQFPSVPRETSLPAPHSSLPLASQVRLPPGQHPIKSDHGPDLW